MKNINQAEWQELIANDSQAVILDVRTLGECAEGIQANAQMIDFLDQPSFMASIKELDTSKNYYIYCRSGNRSGQACQILDNMGVQSTYNLTGGMMAWTGETVAP